jgi:hypothetical protein
MKGLIGLMVTAALGVGIYLYSLKQASPGPGMVATQAISTTGVQNDLIGIAQAERIYFTQNSAYTDLATLASTGTMNIARTGRDGYTYTAEASGTTFTVTARYTAPPPEMPKGVSPPRFPTYIIDQTMEIHQGD